MQEAPVSVCQPMTLAVALAFAARRVLPASLRRPSIGRILRGCSPTFGSIVSAGQFAEGELRTTATRGSHAVAAALIAIIKRGVRPLRHSISRRMLVYQATEVVLARIGRTGLGKDNPSRASVNAVQGVGGAFLGQSNGFVRPISLRIALGTAQAVVLFRAKDPFGVGASGLTV